jgi:ATP-binding cassette subfamily B protein
MSQLFQRAATQTAAKTLRIFWQEIKKDKKKFATYTILVPINRLLYMVTLPLLFSFVIQSLITQPDNWQHPAWLLVAAAAVSIASLITSHIGIKVLFRHEEEMRTSLIKRAMTALLSHSDQFFANRKIGSIAGDVNAFSSAIMKLLDIIYLQASSLVVNFVVSLIVIGIMSPILLIPLGISTGLLIWRSIVAVSARGELRHKRKTLTARLNGTVADILGNQQIVRYFASHQRELRRVKTDRREIESIAFDEIDIIQREMFTRQAGLFAFQIITMGVCIWLYTNDMVSIAALIFAITYLGRLMNSLFDITPIIRGTEQVFIDTADITDILDEQPGVTDKKDAKSLAVTKGGVLLDTISFSYEDDSSKVINNLALAIKPGERIGLAGHSGGGKTTLTKLLLRFADVTGGSITIDGQNISDVTQASLRENIAYVPQEPYMFHRSLRDNIAYGKPDASDDEIIRAAKRANAYEFVKDLPNGLDTVVGERGIKLSGGQRQRVAIARAILKDAPILILDEATSALDSESEKLIQDALAKLMKGRTAIVVAHRLSTISRLDRIVVIDHGQIAEQGTHDALLKQGGMYASLWAHQSGGFIEE